MEKKVQIICTGCPLGCEVSLVLDDKGEVVSISGNKCKEGQQYALEEYKNPVRVLTATVLTKASARRLLPVRTNRPVPRDRLRECMYVLARVRVKPPIGRGEVIVPNIRDTGADLVATDELRAEKQVK